MCMISLKPNGVELPKREYLFNGWIQNNDGLGIAVADGQTVVIKKHWKYFDDMYKWIEDNVKVSDVLLVHFRLATHGLNDAGNRHPFPVTVNVNRLRQTELVTNMAMAHNGIFRDIDDHHKLSDTQLFVQKILAPIRQKVWNNSAIIKLLETYMDCSNKVVLINVNKECIKFGYWYECEGIFYSNEDYKPAIIQELKRIIKYKCAICDGKKKLKWNTALSGYLCKKCRRSNIKQGYTPFTYNTFKKAHQKQEIDGMPTRCELCDTVMGIDYRHDLEANLCEICYDNMLVQNGVYCEQCAKSNVEGLKWRVEYSSYLCTSCYVSKCVKDYGYNKNKYNDWRDEI